VVLHPAFRPARGLHILTILAESETKRLKTRDEEENRRLQRIVADQVLNPPVPRDGVGASP
jgi:hypothetical protein